MLIDVKYKEGDFIEYKELSFSYEKETCPCCNGKGEIQGEDNNLYTCPNCKGMTVIKKRLKSETIIKHGTVYGISVRYDNHTEDKKLRINYYTEEENFHPIDQEDIIKKLYNIEDKNYTPYN